MLISCIDCNTKHLFVAFVAPQPLQVFESGTVFDEEMNLSE